MDIKEYISSGIIESYVLGVVSDQERREVECMSTIYPELQEHLLAVQGNLEQLAESWKKEPPVELKAKIMAEIGEDNAVAQSIAARKAKIIKMKKAKQARGVNTRSAAAASVILVLAAGALFFMKANELGKTEAELSKLKEEFKTNQQLVADMNVKLEDYDLKQAFITDDRTVTIALAGTTISPEAKVKAYWNKKVGEVMLVGMNLPQHEIDKQYQLWAIVDGTPVDLGMLDASNPNTAVTKKVKSGEVQAFAITLERKGGSPAPNLEQLYVIGNVKA